MASGFNFLPFMRHRMYTEYSLSLLLAPSSGSKGVASAFSVSIRWSGQNDPASGMCLIRLTSDSSMISTEKKRRNAMPKCNSESNAASTLMQIIQIAMCLVVWGVLFYLIFQISNLPTQDNVTVKRSNSDGGKWVVRYLRLQRVDNSLEHVQVNEMALYDGSVRIFALSGRTFPMYNVPHDRFGPWIFANDANSTTTAMTDRNPEAFIELDFGDNRSCDRIRVVILTDDNPERHTTGLLLTASDDNRKIIVSFLIDKPHTTQVEFRHPRETQIVRRM